MWWIRIRIGSDVIENFLDWSDADPEPDSPFNLSRATDQFRQFCLKSCQIRRQLLPKKALSMQYHKPYNGIDCLPILWVEYEIILEMS